MSVLVIVLCVLAVLGVIIATTLLLIILGLGFAGIISSSLIYGLYKKSLEKAFKLFTIAGSGFCGMVFCSIIFPVVNKISHWTTFGNALTAGIAVGTISGVLTGFIVYLLIKYLSTWFVNKLNLCRLIAWQETGKKYYTGK